MRLINAKGGSITKAVKEKMNRSGILTIVLVRQ
jgi:hypothetical protein